jgi:hypothetical protein
MSNLIVGFLGLFILSGFMIFFLQEIKQMVKDVK